VPPRLADQLRAVFNVALQELEPVWTVRSVDALTETLHEVMPAFIDTWASAAAALAADWYDNLREDRNIDGLFTAIVAELGEKGADALVGWATEPLRQPDPDFLAARDRLEGGAQRRIADSARETIMGSAIDDPQARGWARFTNGDSCAFCLMLAARGGVYTEKTSRFGAHDNCDCSAGPVWDQTDLVKVDAYQPSEKNITPAERQATREWIEKNYPGHEGERLKRKNQK
jgi:hypothetical protein